MGTERKEDRIKSKGLKTRERGEEFSNKKEVLEIKIFTFLLIHLLRLTEVWEKKENVKYPQWIEKLPKEKNRRNLGN